MLLGVKCSLFVLSTWGTAWVREACRMELMRVREQTIGTWGEVG